MSGSGSDSHHTLVAWLSEKEDQPLPSLGAVRLPRVALGENVDAHTDLVLGEVLGTGGMAVVHRALQVALERDVAVKQARSQEPAAVAGLVREAVIGARLQHPNIVPVHFVAETGEGEPVVVMRAVEGQTWAELSRDGVGEGRHLEIFHALCRALSYAHSTGFVHRDLKPANVLLGAFGEIYLLDWGVAVALDERIRAPAGTPTYMAPEAKHPGPVDVRLDVFGLAASLAAALTGSEPRRDKDGGLAPVGLPPGLTRVLARAGAADPSQRTPDIETLRREVVHWEDEREVEALLDAAHDRRATLEAAVGLTDAREQFAIARFAYGHVLERRPEHDEAREGLVACHDWMVRKELEGGRIEAAEGLLAIHPGPDPALREAVAEARAAHDRARAEDERLRAVARSVDLSNIRSAVGKVMVGVVVAVLASVAINRALLGPPSAGEVVETSWRLVWIVLLPWAAMIGLVGWQYRSLTPSVAGERAARGAVLFGTLLVVARIGTAAAGLHVGDRPAVLAYEPVFLVAFALGQAPLSPRFLVAAIGGALTWLLVLAAFWTEWITGVYNLAVFTTLLLMVWAWEGAQRGEPTAAAEPDSRGA